MLLLRHHDLLNYWTDHFKMCVFRKTDSILFLINCVSKNCFNKKKSPSLGNDSAENCAFLCYYGAITDNYFYSLLYGWSLKSRNYGAASSGGHGNLSFFIYFLWPPLEAGLSISMYSLLLHVLWGFGSLYTRCLLPVDIHNEITLH
jgi:hypothetical protein